MDELVHGTAADGTIRVFAAVTTDILREAVRRHGTSPTASAAFGRTLTGALLLGGTLKDYDRLTIRIDCEGPIRGIVAETPGNGAVRGYVKDPTAELPPSSNGKFNVGALVGEGTFYVIRESGFDIGLHKEPYVGSVPIVTGEIAEDLAYYLAKSEQIPSAVLLGVLLENSEPYVTASGGILIQMLPGANEHIITMIEDTIRHAPHLTSIIRDGAGPKDLLRLGLGDIDFEVLETYPVYFRCNCSFERAIVLISSLGKGEVRSMLNEENGARMTCGFCNEEYVLTGSDLEAILAE